VARSFKLPRVRHLQFVACLLHVAFDIICWFICLQSFCRGVSRTITVPHNKQDSSMSDGGNEQQRRLEAKREYNRRLSALKRQQVKAEIAALTANAEMQKDRADKCERENIRLLDQVRVLSEANQNLTERLDRLTAAVAAGATGFADIGSRLNSGHRRGLPLNGVAVVSDSSGTEMRGGVVDSGASHRFLQQLAGHHSFGTTADSSRHHGDWLWSHNTSSNSTPAVMPIGGRPRYSNLDTSTQGRLNQHELDLLTRHYYSARNNSNNISEAQNADMLLLGEASSFIGGGESCRQGIASRALVAAAPSAAVSAAAADPRVAQFLVANAATRRDAAFTAVRPDMLARILMTNHHQSPSLVGGNADLRSVEVQGPPPPPPPSMAEVESRELQLVLLAHMLDERKKAEESSLKPRAK
jgi:hypothetical protein